MSIGRNIESFIISIIVIISGILYSYELIISSNSEFILLSIIIISYNIFTITLNFILSINHWNTSLPKRLALANDNEKHIGIIIPTWKEPPQIVKNTLISIIDQNYRHQFLHIIVSDDAVNYEIYQVIKEVKEANPELDIIYHVPPDKSNPNRIGDGKAGNLNSALKQLLQNSYIQYIETRDADDLVGSKDFLNETVAQLENDNKLAFVQTIKTTESDYGDPFANKEVVFYKYLLVSKNSSNSVFPCGSGIIWRKEALVDIGGFPTWNLVEDFQSGSEAIKKGWKTLYLPILGAIGQIAPEDIPNYYKQRTTWAIDSLRWFFFYNKKELNFIQKLQFSESGLFYIFLAFTYIFTFIPPSILFLNIKPLIVNEMGFLISFTLFTFALFTQQVLIIKVGKIRMSDFLKTIQMSIGMSPIYISSLIKAIVYGYESKPKYVVTRKTHKFGIYLHYVLPQIIILLYTLSAIIYHINLVLSNVFSFDLINMIWCIFYLLIFSRIISLSVFRPYKSINISELQLTDAKVNQTYSTKMQPSN